MVIYMILEPKSYNTCDHFTFICWYPEILDKVSLSLVNTYLNIVHSKSLSLNEVLKEMNEGSRMKECRTL